MWKIYVFLGWSVAGTVSAKEIGGRASTLGLLTTRHSAKNNTYVFTLF
jgi:hypothetical protein